MRAELARLVVELYPAQHRGPGTALIAGPDWILDEPGELRSLRLTLDEQEHGVAIDGSEDVSEALRHEVALAGLRNHHGLPGSAESLRAELPFRSLIGDPFDPARRAINPGVATLTIRRRRYPAGPSFLLHWRDPAKVATVAGVYHVLPAGEFQPASVALGDRRADRLRLLAAVPGAGGRPGGWQPGAVRPWPGPGRADSGGNNPDRGRD